MAVLTNDDFTAHRRFLRGDAAARVEMQTAGLSKSQWKAALQAIEDTFESNRATMKSNMDTAAGVTLSNALAKKLGRVWMQQKFGGE